MRPNWSARNLRVVPELAHIRMRLMPCRRLHSSQNAGVKAVLPLILLLAAVGGAAAEVVPLPRPRPVPPLASRDAPTEVVPLPRPRPVPPQASHDAPACQLLLMNKELAIAAPLETLDGPGECAVTDAVRLEAVVLPDGSSVALNPPATLRCGMAEAIVRWVRGDMAAASLTLGAPLLGIDNYASYHCRGRNNIVGAQLSEHGKANALDIRLVRLADGRRISLTDPHVARDFRERIRRDACHRFSTVLGPGSDGYHEDHVHVDLQERPRGRFAMCQWQVLDPPPPPAEADDSEKVPLPPPRPKFEATARGKL
jgi:hypothetical protein